MAARRLSLELDLDSGSFTAKMRAAGQETQVFQRRVLAANAAIDRIDRGVNGATARLRDFTLIMGNLRSAVENAHFFMVGWVEALVNASAQMERTSYLLRGLSDSMTEIGRRTEAQDNLEGLMETARRAPFSINALSDTFVKFRSGGLDPTNGSMQSLLDAVAAFGGSDELLHRASVAIQQMGGKGVISMEELRQQLGEAVPTAIELMARGLGKSYRELVDEISRGSVEAGPALDAMFREFDRAFGGSAERMMQTFQGRVSQLQTAFVELAMAFTGLNMDGSTEVGSFYDRLKGTIVEITQAIQSDAFKGFARDIGEAVGMLVDMGVSIAEIIGQIAQMMPGFINVKTVIIGLIALVGTRLMGAFATAFGKGKDKIAEATGAIQRQREAVRNIAQAEADAATRRVSASQNIANSITGRIARLEAEERQLRANAAAAEQARQNAIIAQRTNRDPSTGRFMSNAAAHQAEHQALQRLAVANQRLEVVTNDLGRAKTNLTRVNGVLTASQVRATAAATALAAAQRAMSGAALLAANAVRGLNAALGVFGGPWGIALMAAITGIAIAWDRVTSATRSAEEASAAIRETNIDTIGSLQQVVEWQEQYGVATDTTLGILDDLLGITDDVTAATDEAGLAALRRARRERILTGEILARAAADQMAMGEQFQEDGDTSRNLGRFQGGFAAFLNFVGDNEVGEGFENFAEESNRRAQSQYAAAAQAYRNSARLNRLRVEVLRTSDDALAASGGAEEEETETPDVGSGGGSRGRSGQTAADRAAQMLASNMEAVQAIEAEIAGATTEAAKLQALLDHDPALRGLSAEMRDNLMASAEALDIANERMEGFRAFEGLNDQLEEHQQAAAGLREELDLVAAGMSEHVAENGRYRASLQQAADAAEVFAEGSNELADEVARAQREVVELQRAVRAMNALASDFDATTATANDMFDAIYGGAGYANREMIALNRAIEEHMRIIRQTGDAEKIAAADRLANAQRDAFSRVQALEAAEEMAQRTREIENDLMLDRNAASEALMQREVERYRRLVEAHQGSADERARIEQTYAAYVEALRREQAARNPIVQMAQDWANLGDNMKQSIAEWGDSFVTELMNGRKSWGDFVADMLKSLAAIIIRALIAKAILTALGMSGGGGVTPMPQAPMNLADVLHSGGIVGSGEGEGSRKVNSLWFAGAPRFHDGGLPGLKPNEVPAILEKGEGVFTREQMAALGGGTGEVNVQVNVVNQSGTKLEAEQGGTRFDGRSYIIDVVVEAASRPGKMRDAIGGASR